MPQWGGLVVVNPNVTGVGANFSVDTDPLFTTFRAQLRVLLGLSPPERVFNVPSKPGTGVQMWQVHRLARVRTLQRIGQASEALIGLLAAVDELPDLVVGEDIQRSVHDAVAAAAETKLALDGHDLMLACRGAASAARLAEAALQHPSLLAMLYFPEEDKYALCVGSPHAGGRPVSPCALARYVPFFLPVAIGLALNVKAFCTRR